MAEDLDFEIARALNLPNLRTHPVTGMPVFVPWSSSILSAFEVVEAMRERGWFLVLETLPTLTDAQFWSIGPGFGKRKAPLEAEHTPALAIVKAALAALREEDPVPHQRQKAR